MPVTKRPLLMVNGPLPEAADNRCGTARSRRLNDLIGGFRIADGLECLVDAAVSELLGFQNRIDGGSIDGMGGAEFLGGFQLVVDDVHRNDGIGAETMQGIVSC